MIKRNELITQSGVKPALGFDVAYKDAVMPNWLTEHIWFCDSGDELGGDMAVCTWEWGSEGCWKKCLWATGLPGMIATLRASVQVYGSALLSSLTPPVIRASISAAGIRVSPRIFILVKTLSAKSLYIVGLEALSKVIASATVYGRCGLSSSFEVLSASYAFRAAINFVGVRSETKGCKMPVVAAIIAWLIVFDIFIMVSPVELILISIMTQVWSQSLSPICQLSAIHLRHSMTVPNKKKMLLWMLREPISGIPSARGDLQVLTTGYYRESIVSNTKYSK
jgi:hypothetical protein